MMSKIALCADSQCLNDPPRSGLRERILDRAWIVPFADALIARKYLREHDVAETWVVSNDTIDGINLAAALKKDNARQAVRLFLSSPSGSKDEPLSKRWSDPHLRKPRIRPSLYCPQTGPRPSPNEAGVSGGPFLKKNDATAP